MIFRGTPIAGQRFALVSVSKADLRLFNNYSHRFRVGKWPIDVHSNLRTSLKLILLPPDLSARNAFYPIQTRGKAARRYGSNESLCQESWSPSSKHRNESDGKHLRYSSQSKSVALIMSCLQDVVLQGIDL